MPHGELSGSLQLKLNPTSPTPGVFLLVFGCIGRGGAGGGQGDIDYQEGPVPKEHI